MTWQRVACVVVWLAWIHAGTALGADVILNEYNAVNGNDYLNGGTASQDEDGGFACDSYFGRVQGNGGDWFELVVITDHLDMRGWNLEIWMAGVHNETLDLTYHALWSDLRSGTIITVAEDVPADVSYNPQAGDWWINVQADDSASGTYIRNSGFPVTNDDWQLTIRDANGNIVFGPAGEGISPESGVNSREIFRLEANPDASITPDSEHYDDGNCLSTFGSPNRWDATEFGFRNRQNFRALRGYNAADFDENGIVDLADFSILARTWSATGNDLHWNPDCDISIPADDVIDTSDLSVFVESYILER
jgi:hypothetical protein